MRLILFTAFLLLFTVQVYAQPSIASDKRFKSMTNQWITFDQVQGDSLTILDFWATWCKPCIKSIPHMVSLSNDLKARGVAVVGVNIDSPRNLAKVRPFSQSLGINYPVLLDPNSEFMGFLQVGVIPTIVYVLPSGKVHSYHVGYKPGDEEVINQQIQSILNELE